MIAIKRVPNRNRFSYVTIAPLLSGGKDFTLHIRRANRLPFLVAEVIISYNVEKFNINYV